MKMKTDTEASERNAVDKAALISFLLRFNAVNVDTIEIENHYSFDGD